MVVVASFWLSSLTPQYEIVPENATGTILMNGTPTTVYFYVNQTTLPLIIQSEWDAKYGPLKDLHRNLTFFGGFIFVLYGVTQWKRWKRKALSWSARSK
jgi:hypothetical protein